MGTSLLFTFHSGHKKTDYKLHLGKNKKIYIDVYDIAHCNYHSSSKCCKPSSDIVFLDAFRQTKFTSSGEK